MGKKKEDKWLQIGNFMVGAEKNRQGNYVVVKDLNGTWQVKWRDDSPMFGIMLGLMDNKDATEYLHSLLVLQYTATTYPHDMISLVKRQECPFMNGFISLVEEQNKYEASLQGKITDEEDKEILEAEKDMIELSEEIKAELEENGNGETD